MRPFSKQGIQGILPHRHGANLKALHWRKCKLLTPKKVLADLSLECAATGKASIYRIDIGYSACFDIPFSIKRDKGVVKGVVRRSEDHGYLGVPNVLVRMDGMFVLSGVPPGVHYIDIG